MNLFKVSILGILFVIMLSAPIVCAQNGSIAQNSSNHVMIHFDEKNVTQFVAQDITSKEQLIPYGIKNPEELKIPSSINKYDVITVDSKLLNEQLKSGKGITISLGEKIIPQKYPG